MDLDQSVANGLLDHGHSQWLGSELSEKPGLDCGERRGRRVLESRSPLRQDVGQINDLVTPVNTRRESIYTVRPSPIPPMPLQISYEAPRPL